MREACRLLPVLLRGRDHRDSQMLSRLRLEFHLTGSVSYIRERRCAAYLPRALHPLYILLQSDLQDVSKDSDQFVCSKTVSQVQSALRQ